MSTDDRCLLFDIPLESLRAPASICTYGCHPDEPLAVVERARDLTPHKYVVAVKNWLWLDLEYPSEKIEKLIVQGFQPACLWSEQVIYDSSGKRQPTCWVISTELIELHDRCIFETRRTLYVMVGSGSRKRIYLNLHKAF